ncbi:MAG TPA: DUF5343 domain-containing protein, partial [Nitrospiraceae bacterium]|nr:DUF5343 domain-containing protein [Nitrospiraceae bacterium]
RIMSNFIDWLREVGVPTRIDRSFWGRRLSGSSGTYLVSALRFLDLLDAEDRPTIPLEEIVKDKEKGKALLRERLMSAYGPVLEGLNLERASFGELQNRFDAEFELKGDTLRKAVTFFVHAAEHAHISLSKFITEKARTVRTGDSKKTVRRPKKDNGETGEEEEMSGDNGGGSRQDQTPAQVLLELLDPETMSEEEQGAIWTLIKFLKRQS